VAKGTHNELLASCEIYRDIHDQQKSVTAEEKGGAN